VGNDYRNSNRQRRVGNSMHIHDLNWNRIGNAVGVGLAATTVLIFIVIVMAFLWKIIGWWSLCFIAFWIFCSIAVYIGQDHDSDS